MVVLDDVENAKLNSRYFDLEAITLNKVAANINSFTVYCLDYDYNFDDTKYVINYN